MTDQQPAPAINALIRHAGGFEALEPVALHDKTRHASVRGPSGPALDDGNALFHKGVTLN